MDLSYTKVPSFGEFINEGKVLVKRRYTDNHPSQYVSSYAPMREKVLSFVKEKNEVSYSDMMEFIKSVNEETGSTSGRHWLSKNAKYFKVIEKNGVKTYKLSLLGERTAQATYKQVI